jgi:hypothetical protein
MWLCAARGTAVLDGIQAATYAVNSMVRSVHGILAAFGLLASGWSAAADDATLLRVFLNDGTSLVSYGELARVGNRVVFSMPTSASSAMPQLHLVNIEAVHVDWDRTTRYAESARAAQYLETRAQTDYALLTGEIAQALNDIALTVDPAQRLAIVERARKRLSDWPAAHFHYKENDVREMLGMLDLAIADLRAAAGVGRFDLNFVAPSERREPPERLLPPPTPREAIEQMLIAARISAAPAERMSLLSVALGSVERDAAVLPADWAETVRAETTREIAGERETDREYRSLTDRMLRLANRRARSADVYGIQRVLTEIGARDQALGWKRPDAVNAIVAAVEAELDAARRLRLARDRWELRLPELRRYNSIMAQPMLSLEGLNRPLEDIKAMAGSSASALSAIERAAAQVLKSTSLIVPPDELRDAHALMASAAQLAQGAARVRREAVLSGDMNRAWDASSAAAGAMMLAARARADIQAALRLPQLAR